MPAGTNDFLPFATAGGANVTAQGTWAGAYAPRLTGAANGSTASSADTNKAIRQASFVASGIAQWLANQGTNVPDDGNLVNLVANLNAQLAGSVVASIAALRNLVKTGSGNAFVLGYYAANDGGGGEYWYDSTDLASADNGGTIIVAADGGRWKLVIGSSISVKQFGAKGDNAADDTSAIANAFTAAAALAGQNTGDLTQRRKVFPVIFPKGDYKVTAKTTVPAGVQVCSLDAIIHNALVSSTDFTLVFNAGSHCYPGLTVHCHNQGGVQFGQNGLSADMVVGSVRVMSVGTSVGQIGTRFLGDDFELAAVDIDGGFIAVDYGDGVGNGCTNVRTAMLLSSVPMTGIRISSTSSHILVANCAIDTPHTLGMQVDSAHDIQFPNLSIIGTDALVGAGVCTSGYGVKLGDFSGAAPNDVSDIVLNLTVNNTAQVDNVVGTAIKISNCNQGSITLNASRATLASGNTHRLKNAIEYGAGNGVGLLVQANIDSAVTPTVGVVAGSLVYRNGAGNVNATSDTFSVAAATAAAHAPRFDQVQGLGQTWQDVTGSRTLGTIYTNSTGKAIEVIVSVAQGTNTGNCTVTVAGVAIATYAFNSSFAGSETVPLTFSVPAGATYSVSANQFLSKWAELR